MFQKVGDGGWPIFKVPPTRRQIFAGIPYPTLYNIWDLLIYTSCIAMVLLDHFANKSHIFQDDLLSVSLSHFLPFPPWVSTSSYLGYQDTAFNSTLSRPNLNWIFFINKFAWTWHCAPTPLFWGTLGEGEGGGPCRKAKDFNFTTNSLAPVSDPLP